MTWAKLDSKIYLDTKLLDLSFEARWLYLASIAYATDNMTDGVIAKNVLPVLQPENGAVDELVSMGLWEFNGTSWSIHNYLKHQSSKAQIESKRERDAARLRESRERVADESHASRTRVAASDTDTDTDTDTESELSESVYTDSSFSILSKFDDFWTAYPRKEGKKPALARFRQAVKVARPEVIIAGAVRYRDDPNREDGFTKLAATWLNQECWNDPPLPRRNNNGMVDQARRAPVMTLDEILGTMATKELEQ